MSTKAKITGSRLARRAGTLAAVALASLAVANVAGAYTLTNSGAVGTQTVPVMEGQTGANGPQVIFLSRTVHSIPGYGREEIVEQYRDWQYNATQSSSWILDDQTARVPVVVNAGGSAAFGGWVDTTYLPDDYWRGQVITQWYTYPAQKFIGQQVVNYTSNGDYKCLTGGCSATNALFLTLGTAG